jgi:hypothetical protein
MLPAMLRQADSHFQCVLGLELSYNDLMSPSNEGISRQNDFLYFSKIASDTLCSS